MGPKHNSVHFKHLLWCLFIKSRSRSTHLYAGKRCNGNPIFTFPPCILVLAPMSAIKGLPLLSLKLEAQTYYTLNIGLPLLRSPSILTFLEHLFCSAHYGLTKLVPKKSRLESLFLPHFFILQGYNNSPSPSSGQWTYLGKFL